MLHLHHKHPGKKNQELVPGKMMKCTCDHPGIATASSQNQAAFFQHLQSSQLPSCPISHLFIPFFLTGAKRREWMAMGVAGRIITIMDHSLIPSSHFSQFFPPFFWSFSRPWKPSTLLTSTNATPTAPSGARLPGAGQPRRRRMSRACAA